MPKFLESENWTVLKAKLTSNPDGVKLGFKGFRRICARICKTNTLKHIISKPTINYK